MAPRPGARERFSGARLAGLPPPPPCPAAPLDGGASRGSPGKAKGRRGGEKTNLKK